MYHFPPKSARKRTCKRRAHTNLFRKPDEIARHQARQAAAKTYSILSKLLFARAGLALILSLVHGNWDSCSKAPFLLYLLTEAVHQIAQLYYKSKAAGKDLGKRVALRSGAVLFRLPD